LLNRREYSKLPIEDINIKITVYQKMINWYQDYISREGSCQYTDDQINKLYNTLAEYLIARDIHVED
jgi:hypothetical protein